MWINVILAIDERLEDVEKAVKSLRKTYGPGAPIALATYGGVAIGAQPKVKAYAAENGFVYYDVPRHSFLTEEDSKEWHACEILARMQITDRFAAAGYGEIYIMHADVRILKDFRPFFKNLTADEAWSFVAILLRADRPFPELCDRGSWGLYFDRSRSRLADILVRYNPAFVADLYAKEGDFLGVWRNFLSGMTLWGDLAQFDLAREVLGYRGRFLKEESDLGPMLGGAVVHEPRERIPACLTEATRIGLGSEGLRRNYERRRCAT